MGGPLQHVVHSRLTFHQAFAYAHEHLSGKVVCVANADVYFDHSLGLIGSIDLEGK